MLEPFILQLKKIRQKGSFVRNVSIASTWSVGIILTQFFLSPIITRLYSPEEYGVYALFSSIVVNIAVFGSLKYNEAIVLASSNRQRNNTVFLSFMFVVMFSLITCIIVFFFKDSIADFFQVKSSGDFLYLVSFGVLLTSTFEIFANINIGRKRYFNNGMSGFVNGLIARSYNIIHAWFISASFTGLITGDFLGKITGITSMLFSFNNLSSTLRSFWNSVSIKTMMVIAKQHKSFPLYFLPSSILIYLSGHLPIYFFQLQFGSMVVGAYALASSLLEIFNRFIPYALAPVFLQKATELKRISHNHLCQKAYRLFLYTLGISTIIFSGVALFSTLIFPILFGGSWEMAGSFAAILAIQYAFYFVAVALSEMYNVMGRQRFLLGNSVLTVLLKIIAVVVISYMGLHDQDALLVYSLVSSIGGIFLIVGVFVILNYKVWYVSVWLLLSMTILLLSLFCKQYIHI